MTAFVGARLTDTMSAAVQTANGRAFGLGDRYVANDGKEYVYVQASAAVAQYDVVTITTAYAAASLSTSNDGRGNLVGVAPVAFASSEFGWVQVKGPATIAVLASAAANVRLNTTATAGSLDDDGTTGAMAVDGLVLTTANGGSAGSAAGILNYPAVGVTL